MAASGPEDVQDAINAMKALLDMVMKENKVLKERLDEVQGAGGGHGGGQAPNAAGGQAIDPLTGTGDPWRGQSPGQSPPGPPGMASPTPAILPPKAPERKDVEGPAKYGGNPDEWLAWSKNFKKFLRRREPRWFALLEKIEEQRCKPVTATLEAQ